MTASGSKSKSKSCRECTKRRIICDNSEPSCNKCLKKGIHCSGSGRIRFSGVALRGKLRDGFGPQPEAPSATPSKIRWKSDQPKRVRRTRQLSDISENETQTPQQVRDDEALSQAATEMTDSGTSTSLELVSRSPESIPYWIPSMDPQVRMSMSHFAEHVAPVMVVLDHVGNGYRDIILPLACSHDLLRRAVGVVAAQHFALSHPSFQGAVDQGRADIISQLRQDAFQASPDHVFNQGTWATIIVLLVGETITGSSEYGHLLQTLLCLFQHIGHLNSSTTRFLTQQTHMFEFLGQPLLGETQGINALRLPLENYLDWICYDLPSDSEDSNLLFRLRMAFIKASHIYLGRTSSDEDQWQLIENLKELVSQIDPERVGAHALVWVCFIGAADSTDPEHRKFFINRLKQVFTKTRFNNILSAINALPGIWRQKGSWTRNLTLTAPTLIM
ncbi:unnamed protein product [Penicillium manginii]